MDAMLASPSASGRARRPGSRYPVVTLLREVEKRKSVTHLRVQKGDDVVEWRRAT